MDEEEVTNMMRKFIAAFLALAVLAALIPGSLADSGSQKHYNGLVGADSPLYTIKVYIQNMDVYLTFNNTDKLRKQMALADERLAEAQDAADDNDSAAYDAATGELVNTLNDMNETLQADDVDPEVASDLVPLLFHHQEVFYGIADNNTTPLVIQNRTVLINGEFMKIKNGMPFYYYNGTAYFMPPGQMNKITNGSKVPPGLVNKGYVAPSPTVVNGSKSWPWDQIPYPTSKKNNGNGNGHGNPNK
jgi:hypothetical protein